MDRAELCNIIETHINPTLLEHKGWIELEDINNSVATIHFRGTCSLCEGTKKTLDELIIPLLRTHAPEIREVHVSEYVSQELYDLALSLLAKKNR